MNYCCLSLYYKNEKLVKNATIKKLNIKILGYIFNIILIYSMIFKSFSYMRLNDIFFRI